MSQGEALAGIIRSMKTSADNLARVRVSLTAEQRSQLEHRGHRELRTVDELVREAVDLYLAARSASDEALASTFGMSPNLEVASRDEWDRA